MTCSTCGLDGHNSRTCEGKHQPCPKCGKPYADMRDPNERHDPSYCSPIKSPDCWDWDQAVDADTGEPLLT